MKKSSGPHYHESVFQENLTADHPYPHYDKAHFSWIAPEYLQHPKSIQWWVTGGLIVLIAVVLEALTGNWTMLFATIVFAGVYWFTHEYHPPKHTKVNLSELGVKIGHRQIPYEEIESFWIIYNPPEVKRLFLRLKDNLLSDLIIELQEQDPVKVRNFLEKYLSERIGVKEKFTDVILRLIKL